MLFESLQALSILLLFVGYIQLELWSRSLGMTHVQETAGPTFHTKVDFLARRETEKSTTNVWPYYMYISFLFPFLCVWLANIYAVAMGYTLGFSLVILL